MDSALLPLHSSLRLRFSASSSSRHSRCCCSSSLLPPARRRRTEGVHLLLLGRLQPGSALKWNHMHAGSRTRRQQGVFMAVGKSSARKSIQPVEDMREKQADSEVSSSSPSVDNAVMMVQPKRKRGRPKKVQEVLEEEPTTAASTKAQEKEEEDAKSRGQSEQGTISMQNTLEEEEKKNAQGLSEDEEIEKFLLGGNWKIMIDGKEEESNRDEGDEDDDDDDDGQPLWVDEEDPTWPDEGEDGWGFRTSQFFEDAQSRPDKQQKCNDEDDEDEEDDELAMNWETEADNWVIKEITTNDWEATVFADPSPLVVYLFARYGPRGPDGWNMLKELEKAVMTIWESHKAPLRAVKVDVGLEIDLASALQINTDECPALLFIKNGKGFQRLQGFRNSEELMQIMAYYFYSGTRPSCLDQTPTTENVKRIAEV